MRSEKEVDFGTHVHTLCPFPTEVLTVYHPNSKKLVFVIFSYIFQRRFKQKRICNHCFYLIGMLRNGNLIGKPKLQNNVSFGSHSHLVLRKLERTGLTLLVLQCFTMHGLERDHPQRLSKNESEVKNMLKTYGSFPTEIITDYNQN